MFALRVKARSHWLEQRTLALPTARLGPGLAFDWEAGRGLSVPGRARLRPGRNVSIGKLDIEALAGGDGTCRADAAPLTVAQQGIAALQAAVVAERPQQLGGAVEVAAAAVEAGKGGASQASGEHLETLP